ncbi:signal peptidase I [Thalassotalea agarivorans]|uniref:Signal peptidase I n=1 Tax=Thalassotalea agarivorans TaxID=349064 RepID=A0A1I0FZ96_THASX|nr:signal peptidase I [Thalassotalea agarivorans]SET62917.1 signal peptidase I Serine peptidase. MEROPS family S26A [Thalassotalea agarivorans]
MAVYFSIFLVVTSIVTGIVWLADKFYWAPQRQLKLEAAQAQCATDLSDEVTEKIVTPNAFVDNAVQIFPIIALITVLRSFLYEPFQIPSGSMMPTLLDGDFILVNKYNYGLKDPIARNKFVDIGLPERGDIVVFKFPEEPNVDYIKRVLGEPGDKLVYRNKSFWVKPACDSTQTSCPGYEQLTQDYVGVSEYDDGSGQLREYTVNWGDKTTSLLIDHSQLQRVDGNFEYAVPAGHYLMVGDNRDNSYDGRFWGYVPEQLIVGEAVAIWMSFEFERTEDSWLPTWIPTGIRFDRIGGIE